MLYIALYTNVHVFTSQSKQGQTGTIKTVFRERVRSHSNTMSRQTMRSINGFQRMLLYSGCDILT